MSNTHEMEKLESQVSSQRRIPSQRRSRERVERILTVATSLIVEKGSDALHMSDVALGAGISIGSLYQYFPDKSSIIQTLAEQFNAQGFACVEAELATVQNDAELVAALGRVVDGYYAMFLAEPVMRDLGAAMQSDKMLQAIDAADIQAHANLLLMVLERLHPEQESRHKATMALLTNQLIATTVRLAISVEQEKGQQLLTAFKKLTIENLPDALQAGNSG